MVRTLRIGRRGLLLAFVGGTCALAAHASAAPAPTLFKLTISGTARQQWTYTAAPVSAGGCTRTETSAGIRSAAFRTARPVIVRISAGKVLPVRIRGIRGTVTLRGSNTIDERCASGGSARIEDCVRTRRTFAGAAVRAVSPRPGFLSLAPVGNVRLARSNCPLEPLDVTRRPLGPAPKLLRLPRQVLNERRLARITLRSSPSRQTRFGAPEQGRLEETADWRFTFVRVRG